MILFPLFTLYRYVNTRSILRLRHDYQLIFTSVCEKCRQTVPSRMASRWQVFKVRHLTYKFTLVYFFFLFFFYLFDFCALLERIELYQLQSMLLRIDKQAAISQYNDLAVIFLNHRVHFLLYHCGSVLISCFDS